MFLNIRDLEKNNKWLNKKKNKRNKTRKKMLKTKIIKMRQKKNLIPQKCLERTRALI